MARASFLNDNEYRQYPLIAVQAPVIENDLIVDCGFIMGIDSGYVPGTHIVYLSALRRAGNALEIEFRTTAPGALSTPLIFSREANDEDWAEEYVESAPGGKLCATEPLWSGFFISGVAATTINKMAAASQLQLLFTPAQATVEPGRVQTLVNSYLRSVSVGNYARQIIPPCGSPPNNNTLEIVPNGTCISGHIKLKPGYNCEITQRNFDNTLTLTAAKTATAASQSGDELCLYGSEIPIRENEQPPFLTVGGEERSKFLSGGLACDQTITSINGLGGPDVIVVGGAGIEVVPDPVNENGLLLRLQNNLVNKVC